MKIDISIVLPVLNEEKKINSAIQALDAQAFDGSFEIIVVDGHSKGTTLKQIAKKQIIKLISLPGRGRQMNAGAGKAKGSILLFLHCDSFLPAGALNAILNVIKQQGAVAGAFDLAIDADGFVFRMIEKTASIRSRLTKIPYGDQAVFIRKDYFFDMGQYAPYPIMEDVDLMKRIKIKGGKIHILKLQAITSARRWQKEGLLYCTLRNWTLLTLFFLGIKPETLVKFYKS